MTLDEESGCASHPGAEALVYILLHSGLVLPAAQRVARLQAGEPPSRIALRSIRATVLVAKK